VEKCVYLSLNAVVMKKYHKTVKKRGGAGRI
jgi:hypothetical protein